jgi:hypothetical protein
MISILIIGGLKMATKIKTTNPYSGQSAMLTEQEHKLYIDIKAAEVAEDYDTMQKKLDKFSRLNVPAYMTLLD